LAYFLPGSQNAIGDRQLASAIQSFRGLQQFLENPDRDEKKYFLGCHRTLPPAATVERMRALMPHMGITRIANVTGLDRIGVPVVMVCRPNARSLAVSQGKGLDLAAAIASGLMESVELYHAEHVELPLKLMSLRELATSHAVVDVGRLPRVAGGRFDPDLVMLWIEGFNLVSGQPRWLPFECVRTDFTLPPPPGSGCFDCSSNGLASGNTLGEAVCHAICEVIERDATAIWNQSPANRRRQTGLVLESVDDTACRQVLERLESAEFDVAVWDTTGDIGAASFFCLIIDRRSRDGHCGIGAGTHPAREIALLRALTEAVQVRTTYISGTRDDLLPEDYGEAERARKRQLADGLLRDHRPLRSLADVPDLSSRSLSVDLSRLLERLKGAGVTEVLAVDLTQARFEVPVVRVVIPGLEGPDDHDAYVPGERVRRLGGRRP